MKFLATPLLGTTNSCVNRLLQASQQNYTVKHDHGIIPGILTLIISGNIYKRDLELNFYCLLETTKLIDFLSKLSQTTYRHVIQCPMMF